jgi:hypothetical protein
LGFTPTAAPLPATDIIAPPAAPELWVPAPSTAAVDAGVALALPAVPVAPFPARLARALAPVALALPLGLAPPFALQPSTNRHSSPNPIAGGERRPDMFSPPYSRPFKCSGTEQACASREPRTSRAQSHLGQTMVDNYLTSQ